MFHGFKYIFFITNKEQIQAGIISKESQLSIILSNALPLSLSSLIICDLKTGKSTKLYLHPIFTKL